MMTESALVCFFFSGGKSRCRFFRSFSSATTDFIVDVVEVLDRSRRTRVGVCVGGFVMVATESEYSFCFFFFVSLAIIVWLCTVWCAAFILEEFFHVKHVCVCPEGGGGLEVER